MSVTDAADDAGADRAHPPRTRILSADASAGPGAVLRDLADGFAMSTVWRTFAWDEIQNRYRRSVLGVAWIAVSYLFFVVGIVVLFRGYTETGSGSFVHYVAVGYACFIFLVGNLTDGCEVFRANATWLKSTDLPRSVYVFKSVARSAFPFALQLAMGLVVMVATGWRPGLAAVLVAPALLAYFVTAVALQLLLGHLAARLPDVRHLISTIQRLLFFTTPIMWVYAEREGAARVLAAFNPLTHYVEVFRAPLLGDPVAPAAWPLVIACTAAAWAAALLVAGAMRRRLTFWV